MVAAGKLEEQHSGRCRRHCCNHLLRLVGQRGGRDEGSATDPLDSVDAGKHTPVCQELEVTDTLLVVASAQGEAGAQRACLNTGSSIGTPQFHRTRGFEGTTVVRNST